MRDIVRYLLRSGLTISPGCAVFRRKDALKNLMPEVPNASGRYGKNSGVGEDLLLFLLTSLDYPRYAHVAEPIACFLTHPQSITVNAITSNKYVELAAAYANAKCHYFRQPKSEQSRSGVLRLADDINWHFSSGTLLIRALDPVKAVFRRAVR
jgi:hypothetical protein